MCDWNWELILDYVEALAWPLLVAAIVLLFRSQIAARVQALTEVEGLGVKARMDGEVRVLSEKVDAAANRVDPQHSPTEANPSTDDQGKLPVPEAPDSPDSSQGSSQTADEPTRRDREMPASADGLPAGARTGRLNEDQALALLAAGEQLVTPADFGIALDVATTSPNAAVMLAYTQLEKTARAAWTVTTMEPDSPRQTSMMIIRELTAALGPEFPGLARELADVRNRVVHGAGEVSLDGAVNFIASCERLAGVLGNSAASKLRHPSRSQVLREAWDVLGLDVERP